MKNWGGVIIFYNKVIAKTKDLRSKLDLKSLCSNVENKDTRF